jgi:hypothetical protein
MPHILQILPLLLYHLSSPPLIMSCFSKLSSDSSEPLLPLSPIPSLSRWLISLISLSSPPPPTTHCIHAPTTFSHCPECSSLAWTAVPCSMTGGGMKILHFSITAVESEVDPRIWSGETPASTGEIEVPPWPGGVFRSAPMPTEPQPLISVPLPRLAATSGCFQVPSSSPPTLKSRGAYRRIKSHKPASQPALQVGPHHKQPPLFWWPMEARTEDDPAGGLEHRDDMTTMRFFFLASPFLLLPELVRRTKAKRAHPFRAGFAASELTSLRRIDTQPHP